VLVLETFGSSARVECRVSWTGAKGEARTRVVDPYVGLCFFSECPSNIFLGSLILMFVRRHAWSFQAGATAAQTTVLFFFLGHLGNKLTLVRRALPSCWKHGRVLALLSVLAFLSVPGIQISKRRRIIWRRRSSTAHVCDTRSSSTSWLRNE